MDGGPPTPQQLTQLARTAVPHAEAAGITLVQGGRRPRTLAATSELPVQVDAIQYATGEGPCLEAIDRPDVLTVSDLDLVEHWPSFGPQCVAETGVRSMFSVRLVLAGESRAALNFYARGRNTFGETDLATGALLAPFTALALQAALNEQRANNLEEALHSSRLIGAAIGILMARELVSQDEAFAILSKASQDLNRKLRDVAAEVTETGTLPSAAERGRRKDT